jgi:hypothetical protein
MQFEALDRAMSIARPKASKLFGGGDGGIRTPVQKANPQTYYKLSSLIVARPQPLIEQGGFWANPLIFSPGQQVVARGALV